MGETDLLISEEEREANFHIIGQPRQGKSKLIEYNIRKDIDLGNGLCLLDPSDNGDTAKKVLRYCALKGIEKVVYIDPDTLFKFGKIATLQPLKPYPYIDQSVDTVQQSVDALFGIARQTDTNRIRRNFSSLLSVLANQGLTLYETKYFRRYQDAKTLPFLGYDEDSMIIKDNFRSLNTFETYFLTTVGRMDTFRKEPLSLITGSNTGIDFVKMIAEGWVILVNLYPRHSLSVTQARLLGILIISEIIHAADVLYHAHPEGEIKKVFYLYMDEAARFASPQIKDIIDYKGKTGIRLIVAHHGFSQFRLQGQDDVLEAIKSGCRIKMMFNVSKYKDRLEMVEDLGYGGDIPPVLAAYVNQNIPKREMVIKKDKEPPVRIRVSDVPDIKISDKLLNSYTERILNKPWYLSKEQINEQINQRINDTPRPPRDNTQSAKPRTAPDSKPDSKPRLPKRDNPDEEWKKVF